MNVSHQIKKGAATLWHVQRIKRLIRDTTSVGQLSMITIVEVECTDSDCPGPATQITILSPDMIRRSINIHLPIHEIRAADIAAIRM